MMGDISKYIKSIQQASRGEEVRDSIVDALNQINSTGKYTLALSGRTISLTNDDGEQTVTLPADQDTIYTMTLEGTTLKLTDSSGKEQSVKVVADTSELEKKISSLEARISALENGTHATIDENGVVTQGQATIDDNGIVTIPNAIMDDAGIVTV